MAAHPIIKADQTLDCKGLACPMPIVKTKKAMDQLQSGQVIEVQATDKGSLADIQGWAKNTGHQYVGTIQDGDVLKHFIRKSSADEIKEEKKYPRTVTNEELEKKLGSVTVLDVREPAEYAFNRIPGAVSIPLGELEVRMGELNPEDDIHVVCRTGSRSDMACQLLAEKGYKNVKNVEPGMSGWSGPTETTLTTATGLRPMTAGELATIVLNKEELFILDVRNQSDFDDWKIEGESVEIINIPYFDLLDGVDQALAQIPSNQRLLVVCAKEGSSKFVAEQLVEAGRTNVSYLEGGMKSWSEHMEPVKIGDLKDGGSLYQFVRIGKGCLSYMVISNGEAAVIDTLRMTDVFERFAKDQGATIKHTLDTHLHADHISGGRKLAEQTGATYWLPPKDATEVTFSYEKLEEGRHITVGNTTIVIQPIYSPGHTIGSTSFIVDDQYLLTGDILFIASIGRPDLAGQAEDWVGDLRNTLYNRYKGLAQDLIVLPAHFGKVTELGEGGRVMARLSDLYRDNPGLNIQDEETFRKTVTENLPPQPNAYQEIRQTNMGKITPDEDEQREMEIGPNRCAVHDN